MTNGIPPIKIRGIRQTVPTGYILGRVSPGSGEVELIGLRGLAYSLVGTGLVTGPANPAPAALLPLVNGDNPVGLILAPDGQTVGVPQ